MKVRTALVVGGGIAGSTLAQLLGRARIDTTVVDQAAGPRSGGNPVAVRGLAVPIAERMGVLDALRAAATHTTRELLEHACRDEQLWFDTFSHVQVPQWSRGAIVLVGDAAGCISLFGEGSSMAIVGAATLAQALASHPDDLPTALSRYERCHRTRLRHPHRAAPLAAHLLVPATRAGTALRNTAFRTWPMIARTLIAAR